MVEGREEAVSGVSWRVFVRVLREGVCVCGGRGWSLVFCGTEDVEW